ncbi:MAG: cysteine desulfurase [Legionellales bacterium]|nr:cysteine desulfurase [Legionellales bacterium]
MNIKDIRKKFPILDSNINGNKLVYLDNAATTQKPLRVIEKITDYYTNNNANVHRGLHTLSNRATDLYENARQQIQRYINAKSKDEIVFCRGTTEAINIVAQSFLRNRIDEGDEILISAMEHHSNIIPWQIVANSLGATIKVIPINENGELDITDLSKLISSRTKMVAVSHISNALGTINPVKKIIEICHAKDIPVLLDGAQAIQHQKVDVGDLDCDFYAFSGHKMYGPTGIGVLFAKKKYLEIMSPYQGGGDMIKKVSVTEVEYNDVPYKFEAGTPNIVGAIGLGEAIEFLTELGLQQVKLYEEQLLEYLTEEITKLDGVNIIGTAKEKIGIVSFLLDHIHAHDVATILDDHGIAVRAGHHCAMPIMDFFNIPATTRISVSFYNSEEDVDRCIKALKFVRKMFS